MKTQYINHVAIVIDESSSMSHLKDRVVEQVDNQIKHLAARSKELNQETRVSLYLFSDSARCIESTSVNRNVVPGQEVLVMKL